MNNRSRFIGAITGKHATLTTEQPSFDWQRSNKDFFTRMVQFSELSWASGPNMDHGSYKEAGSRDQSKLAYMVNVYYSTVR